MRKTIPAFLFLFLMSCLGKEELLDYYRQSDFAMTGIITGGKYIQKNVGIIDVDVMTSSTETYMGKMVFLSYVDVELANKKAKVVCGYFNEIRKNDSVVMIINQGIFRIYRKDSLIKDIGLKYFKNGKEEEL